MSLYWTMMRVPLRGMVWMHEHGCTNNVLMKIITFIPSFIYQQPFSCDETSHNAIETCKMSCIGFRANSGGFRIGFRIAYIYLFIVQVVQLVYVMYFCKTKRSKG